MKRTKWIVAGLGLLLLLAVSCTTETAIKSLKIGKDKAVTTETAAFATGDTVYGVAAISSSGKTKVTGRLLIDEVEGQTKGPIPGLEITIDLAKGEDGNFTFSPPPAGWPKGKYTLEVVLTDEAGVQKGTKSANFTVS
jgi:hypothetical protein